MSFLILIYLKQFTAYLILMYVGGAVNKVLDLELNSCTAPFNHPKNNLTKIYMG